MTLSINLDDLDLRILAQLQRDASLTNQDLAAAVHASAATCLRRVRRLRDTGVIQGQVALLDPSRIGVSLTVIIEITLDIQTTEHYAQFEAKAATEDAILQCYRVSPGPDFIVIAQVADMPAYHALAHRAFTSNANIRNVRSFFSVHRSKFKTNALLRAPG